MKFIAISFGTVALTLLAFVAPAGAATPLSSQDSAFATKAAQNGAAEVTDAKLALQTSRNHPLDAFAKRMINDHSKANAQLAAIMHRQGITAPTTIGAANQRMYNKLEGLTGAAFDVAYTAGQQTAHVQTIALFKREASAGNDPQLVAFAKKTLPTLESHLEMLTSHNL